MRRNITTFIVAVLFIGGALYAWNQGSTEQSGEQKDQMVIEKQPALSQPEDKQVKPVGEKTQQPNKPIKQVNTTNKKDKDDTKDTKDTKDTTDSVDHKATSPVSPGKTTTYVNSYTVEHVVAEPKSHTVLVNKTYRLPQGYVPPDLVYPNVPFTFSEKVDKRKMRKVAAGALEKLFAAAKRDGVMLAGVSGYRSESRQTTLYNNYVQRDGVKAADTYSARPGHSEHQTGLTIDVAGSNGKCAAESCFAGTKEAKWLAQHAHEYGFVIRYPEGKDKITGYKYEPWHIRYVGNEIAKTVTTKKITLEQYFGNTVAVSR